MTERIKFINMTQEDSQYDREEYNGWCLNCGAHRYGETEPDARNYECETCGKNEVYGIEELLIMGLINFVEDEDTDIDASYEDSYDSDLIE